MLVHFPIAFLLLYSLLRILPFDRWFPKVSWTHVRPILLVAGILGAFASNMTGEIAEHIARPDHDLVETHAFFALASTWIYGILLAGEAFFVVKPIVLKHIQHEGFLKLFALLQRMLTNRTLTWSLAVLGVLAISITGLLGGVMVYGVSADPLAPFVLKLLGL